MIESLNFRLYLAYRVAKIALLAHNCRFNSFGLWLNNIRLILNGEKTIHYCNWRPLMKDSHIIVMYCKKCGKEQRF